MTSHDDRSTLNSHFSAVQLYNLKFYTCCQGKLVAMETRLNPMSSMGQTRHISRKLCDGVFVLYSHYSATKSYNSKNLCFCCFGKLAAMVIRLNLKFAMGLKYQGNIGNIMNYIYLHCTFSCFSVLEMSTRVIQQYCVFFRYFLKVH